MNTEENLRRRVYEGVSGTLVNSIVEHERVSIQYQIRAKSKLSMRAKEVQVQVYHVRRLSSKAEKEIFVPFLFDRRERNCTSGLNSNFKVSMSLNVDFKASTSTSTLNSRPQRRLQDLNVNFKVSTSNLRPQRRLQGLNINFKALLQVVCKFFIWYVYVQFRFEAVSKSQIRTYIPGLI
ncbi:hypothetical protein C8J55DRAFT_549766 [Lentinula edodes]|uniref:Uncharacterized protein n=1 Tax=Lentinula lateritia TaxID=40482 RepID=A0A9W9AC83_9AGAR|nr:hypothetical protein C8J55DRAFT_549766 [Lentinula edodes]